MAMVNYVITYIAFFFFAFANIEVSDSFISRALSCDQTFNCRCVQRSGDGVDLSPLINLIATGPKFLTAATNRVMYFYRPCSNWSLPSKNETECSHACGLCFFEAEADKENKSEKLDVEKVLSNSVNGTFHMLAYASEAVFQPTETELLLVYNHKNYSAVIHLECERSGPTELVIWNPTAAVDIYNHNLVLRSPYSCVRHLIPHVHYMSGAAVFFLIIFTFFAAYFFGGMLVLRSIKGATGTEMIPNYDFWVSLPGRIKNGFLRLIGKGIQGADTYERI